MLNRPCYPENWPELARACKERAGWKCEECGVAQYKIVTSRKGTPYMIFLAACHINHDKGNPAPVLKALCVSCHARLDYEHKQREARIRLEIVKHVHLLIKQGVVTVKEVNA